MFYKTKYRLPVWKLDDGKMFVLERSVVLHTGTRPSNIRRSPLNAEVFLSQDGQMFWVNLSATDWRNYFEEIIGSN